jgi:uncharacterized protein YbbC (DUF1343 family)
VETGLDRLLADGALAVDLRGKFALLAHPASVDRSLVHVRRALAARKLVPQIVFGPEHGYGGEAQDMIGVADAVDEGGVPIRSLYGADFSDLSPRAEDLRGLDTLLVDLQDVGSRYYTFVWTAVLALRACAAAGVKTVILDRPNPLGHTQVEGKLVKERYRSFVGLESIPVRHSLTLGEIVAWRAEVEGIDPQLLSVVPARGLLPDAHAEAWDRPFVMTSPNMPTYETALVYPGGCLIEGTNLSEGRGTTRPFELVGAPFLDGVRLARELNVLALRGFPGFVARPTTFFPMFQKHLQTTCGGVQIHVTDRRTFRPYATYLALVALAHHQKPEAFRFRTAPYEFVADIPAFDLLTGDDRARLAIEQDADPADVAAEACFLGDADLDVVKQAKAALPRYSV